MFLKIRLRADLRRILTVLLLLIASVVSKAQTITLNVENESIEKVFRLIEKQTTYHFFYATEAISVSKPVSFKLTNEPLVNVLRACFRDQPLTYVFNEDRIVVRVVPPKLDIPGDRVINGKVVNEAGEPVAGVTVNIKGTLLTTATDAAGVFHFEKAPDHVVLVVSGAEIETVELGVGEGAEVLVRVKRNVGLLDETVVIGYGTTTRRFGTGTVSNIKAADLESQPVSNPLSVLGGKMSGVQVVQSSGMPNSSVTIRIRGRNSIANGNNPLVIIDGVPFSADALNGPMGGAGENISSPFDNINPNEIESIEVLKDADASAIYGSRSANGVILITTKKGKTGKKSIDVRYYTGIGRINRKMDLLNTSEYLNMRREAFRNDQVTPSAGNAPDLLVWDTTRFTDWQDELIGNTSTTNDANISTSGGNANDQYHAAFGYHKETTVLPGPFKAEKVSGNLGFTHHSENKRFTLNLTTSYLVNFNRLPQREFANLITLPPDAPPVFDENHNLNWANSTWANPIANTYLTVANNSETFLANLSLSYELIRHLQLKLSAGYSSIHMKENFLSPKASANPAFNPESFSTFGDRTNHTYIIEPQASYHVDFKKHTIELLAGTTWQYSNQQSLYLYGSGYSTDDLITNLAAASTVFPLSQSDNDYKYLGTFARINYNYSKELIIDLNVRRDGSSRYGSANRFANFGSAGAAWIFAGANQSKERNTLSFGKLKASAGTTGNDQIGDYKYLNLYSNYYYSYQGLSTIYPVQLFNPDYSWEQVRKFEISTEFGFLKDHILFNANFYRNLTTNQLIQYALPSQTGFTGIIGNIPAKIVNDGIEFEVTGKVESKQGLNWSGAFNISFPRNRLKSFRDLSSSTYANYYVIGKSINTEKRLAFNGVDPVTGVYQFVDFDHDGQIGGTGDMQSLVSTDLKYFGGIQQTLRYKKVSLNFLVQFTCQPKALNYLYFFSRPGNRNNQPDLVLDRWQQPGDQTTVQRFSNSSDDPNIGFFHLTESDAIFSSASFIRLKNVYLEYDLMNDRFKKGGVEGMKIFLQAQNLLTISSYKGLDPETQSYLPVLRIFTAGVQVTL